MGKSTVFNRFHEIFAYGSLSPNILERNKLPKSVSGYVKTKEKNRKQILLSIKPMGGGAIKALVDYPLKRTFFAASLTLFTSKYYEIRVLDELIQWTRRTRPWRCGELWVG